MDKKETLRGAIRTHYAKVAQGSVNGCCGGGCGCGAPPVSAGKAAQSAGYSQDDLASVPSGANMGLGCGNPLAIASLKEGETVLDLGCGGGLDCFLASRRVCGSGRVIGVDMTPDMIALARENAEKSGYANVEFRLGEIEHLPVADNTADVILSNCVINLAVDKRQVYREAFRVLKPGGRLAVSDVLAVRPLPEALQNDASLVSGCIGGAELVETVRAMLADSGFENIDLRPREQGGRIIGSWGFDGSPENYVASYEIQARKPEKANMKFRTATLPKVAFVCVHNSCRSQIAEALGKHLAGDRFECWSAGTEVKNSINPDAVRIMKERYGIDMEITQRPKLIRDIPPVDIVITMGCNVHCPTLPCKRREDWGLEDPTGHGDAAFHRVIDCIERKIKTLADECEGWA